MGNEKKDTRAPKRQHKQKAKIRLVDCILPPGHPDAGAK